MRTTTAPGLHVHSQIVPSSQLPACLLLRLLAWAIEEGIKFYSLQLSEELDILKSAKGRFSARGNDKSSMKIWDRDVCLHMAKVQLLSWLFAQSSRSVSTPQ